jgi:hypothetical protein
MYHDAAVETFRHDFRRLEKTGGILIEGEHRLSKGAMRIDMVIKKKPGVRTRRIIGAIFRGHNVVEYKRPDDPPLTLKVFNKVVYSYAGTYSWQEDVKLTDMTATIICYKKPEELFDTLKKEFNYKVLRKYDGIYYVSYKGFPADKALAIQVVVVPELPESEFMLKAMAPGCGKEALRKAVKILLNGNGRRNSASPETLEIWENVVLSKNHLTIMEEVKKMNKREREEIVKSMEQNGLLVNYGRSLEKRVRQEGIQEGIQKGMQRGMQKGRQEGIQKGMQKVFTLLENGYSLDETKKKLQFA